MTGHVETAVKAQILQALDYPRTIFHGSVDINRCPHGGFYKPGDQACLECASRYECRWLYSNDEFVALNEKPNPVLVDALDYAVSFVDSEAARLEHNTGRCHCETCQWIRKAQRLLATVRRAPV